MVSVIKKFLSFLAYTVASIAVIVMLIVALSPTVHFRESEGIKIPSPETGWLNIQGVYVLVHPKCKNTQQDNRCINLTEYEDSISAAYQLGRLDFVTVAVSLIAVVMAFGGLFGFLSIREKARADAKEAGIKAAEEVAAKAAIDVVIAKFPELEKKVADDVAVKITPQVMQLITEELNRQDALTIHNTDNYTPDFNEEEGGKPTADQKEG